MKPSPSGRGKRPATRRGLGEGRQGTTKVEEQRRKSKNDTKIQTNRLKKIKLFGPHPVPAHRDHLLPEGEGRDQTLSLGEREKTRRPAGLG